MKKTKRILKSWVESALFVMSGALSIIGVGSVEADNQILYTICMIILLINLLVISKYGRNYK